MKKLISIALLGAFVGLVGCSDTTKSSSKETKTTVKPDGSKVTETKMEEKKETPPAKKD